MKNFQFNKPFYILVLLFFFQMHHLQAQFQIDAQLRPRFECRDGYKKLNPSGVAPSIFISQRSRLNLFYGSENLRIKLSFQDVRTWGDEKISSSTGVLGDDASIDLFEAYAEFRINKTTWLSAGRQNLVYDRERLFSLRNWNQYSISYDALVIKFIRDKLTIHSGFSWNSLSETSFDNLYPPDRIKSLNYIWLNRKFGEKAQLSWIHIASGVTATDSTNKLYFRQTNGFYLDYKYKDFSFFTDIYYQFGKNKIGKNVNALLADAEISFSILKLTIGAGGSFLSGNKDLSGKNDNLFDLLYGARHKYFGHVDYFNNIPSSTKEGGLIDNYMYLSFRLSSKISLSNYGHYYFLAQINQNTPTSKELGYENETEFKYKINKEFSLKASYLFILPTENLKVIQGLQKCNFPQFAFIELTFTPIVFSGDKL